QKEAGNATRFDLEILSQILGSALDSLGTTKRFFFPFLDEGVRLCQLSIEVNENDTWNVRGKTEFSRLGEVGFSAQFSGNKLDIDLHFSNAIDVPDTLTDIDTLIDDANVEVNTTVHRGEEMSMEPMYDLSTAAPPSEPSDSLDVVV
ncbi:MAG: hypothetical protein ABEJ65_02495, partial [bacterium]